MSLPLGDMLFHMYLSDRVDWQTCHQFGEHERIEPRQRMGPLAHGHKNKNWRQMGLLDLTRQYFIITRFIPGVPVIVFSGSALLKRF